MSPNDTSRWISLDKHIEIVHQWEEKWQIERDRRYSEVATEREKALKIKEVADLKALDLASQIQSYKDEQGNELRHQLEKERGLYATKDDLTALGDKLVIQIAGTKTDKREDSSLLTAKVAVSISILSTISTLAAIVTHGFQ